MQTGEGATRSTSSTAEARAARSKATASRVAPSEGQSKRKGGGQTAPAGSESEEALLERLSRVDKILKSPQAAAILRATSVGRFEAQAGELIENLGEKFQDHAAFKPLPSEPTAPPRYPVQSCLQKISPSQSPQSANARCSHLVVIGASVSATNRVVGQVAVDTIFARGVFRLAIVSLSAVVRLTQTLAVTHALVLAMGIMSFHCAEDLQPVLFNNSRLSRFGWFHMNTLPAGLGGSSLGSEFLVCETENGAGSSLAGKAWVFPVLVCMTRVVSARDSGCAGAVNVLVCVGMLDVMW